MAVDEVRVRLRRKLEEMLGMDEADLLMDRPPGGWGDLVTKDYLDARFEAVDARFGAVDARFDVVDARFDALDHVIDARFESLRHEWKGELHREMTLQTWRLIGAVTGLLAIVVAAIRL